jgi:hypothetical protein
MQALSTQGVNVLALAARLLLGDIPAVVRARPQRIRLRGSLSERQSFGLAAIGRSSRQQKWLQWLWRLIASRWIVIHSPAYLRSERSCGMC